MNGPPFLINTRINKYSYINALINSGCLYYAIISHKCYQKIKLPRLEIHPRKMEGFNGKKICITIDSIAYADLNINGFKRKIFFHIVPRQKYDIILGKPWMQDNKIVINEAKNVLSFKNLDLIVKNSAPVPKKKVSIQFQGLIASIFIPKAKNEKNEIFSISIADINKVRSKP
jgi:hypothetical protein